MGNKYIFDDGPWVLREIEDAYIIAAAGGEKEITRVKKTTGAINNARIIAASPDIFQALLCFLTIYEDSELLESSGDERLKLAIAASELALLKVARLQPEGDR